jgi:hypothetical protein
VAMGRSKASCTWDRSRFYEENMDTGRSRHVNLQGYEEQSESKEEEEVGNEVVLGRVQASKISF